MGCTSLPLQQFPLLPVNDGISLRFSRFDLLRRRVDILAVNRVTLVVSIASCLLCLPDMWTFLLIDILRLSQNYWSDGGLPLNLSLALRE